MPDEVPRTTTHCTLEEAKEAVDYLRKGFGGFGIDDQEERQLKRLFLEYGPVEVDTAIDQMIRTVDRRPAANDIGKVLRANRRHHYEQSGPAKKKDGPDPNVTPAEKVPDFIAAVRSGDLGAIERMTKGATT